MTYFAQDYRGEEIGVLLASGQTEEQIDKYFVPKSVSERKKKALSQAQEFEKMKKEIAFLMDEVKHLRGNTSSERDADTHHKKEKASDINIEREK